MKCANINCIQRVKDCSRLMTRIPPCVFSINTNCKEDKL